MPAAKNKSGPMSDDEKQYIKNYMDIRSVNEIASAIERNPKTVRAYIRKTRLGIVPAKKTEETDKKILRDLKKKPFFDSLKTQFTETEIEYFCEYWVLAILDFGGNILSYEELELKEWLTFEILKSRELSKSRINELRKHTIKEELENELKAPQGSRDKERVKYLQGELNVIDEEMKNHTKIFSELAYKADKIKSGLVKSREQRTKDLDTAKIDFSKMIKILQSDVDIKRRMGEEMEIIRMSEEKKRKQMYSLQEYADGQVDTPILNSESAELIKKNG